MDSKERNSSYCACRNKPFESWRRRWKTLSSLFLLLSTLRAGHSLCRISLLMKARWADRHKGRHRWCWQANKKVQKQHNDNVVKRGNKWVCKIQLHSDIRTQAESSDRKLMRQLGAGVWVGGESMFGVRLEAEVEQPNKYGNNRYHERVQTEMGECLLTCSAWWVFMPQNSLIKLHTVCSRF